MGRGGIAGTPPDWAWASTSGEKNLGVRLVGRVAPRIKVRAKMTLKKNVTED